MQSRLFLCLLVCCAAVGCKDRQPLTPQTTLTGLVPKGDVQVVIVQDRTISGDSVVFVVNVVPNGVAMAAYQGTISFSAADMDVLAVRTPDAKEGEFRVVNADAAGTGRIRFAGFTTQAFATTEAFRIVARLHGGLGATNLAGTVDLAGEVAGTSIRSDRLRASEGIRDAVTNQQLLP
jgi:hypothetical protein